MLVGETEDVSSHKLAARLRLSPNPVASSGVYSLRLVTQKLSYTHGVMSALWHVPPVTVARRVRREWRTRQVLANPERIRQHKVFPVEREMIARRLASEAIVRASRRLAELTASSFSYCGQTETLCFLASGDTVTRSEIQTITWSKPKLIPPDQVNRCFFMSFVEQATLLGGAPFANLQALYLWVRGLSEAAPVGDGPLSIPWQTLSAARRLVNLASGLSLAIAGDPKLVHTEEFAYLLDHVCILNSLIEYLREDDLGYNHLATELFAESVFASVFASEDALDKKISSFLECLKDQLGTDGFQLERSATYQAHLLGHLEFLSAGGFALHENNELLSDLTAKMKSALAAMVHPNGRIAVFNDAAIGDGPSPFALNAMSVERKNGLSKLNDAGYARLQAGSLVAIFDAGPCGPNNNPGHAHADFLSFELSQGLLPVIVDPGVASYKASKERDWTRSAIEHNGPAFTDIEPIEFIGAFRVGRRGSAHFLSLPELTSIQAPVAVAGWQDGYDRFGGRVARWIGMWPDRKMIVLDVWRGLPDREARSSFLVPLEWSAVERNSERVILASSASSQRISINALAGGFEFVPDSCYFPVGPRLAKAASKMILRPSEVGPSRTAAFSIEFDGDGETDTSAGKESDTAVIAIVGKELLAAMQTFQTKPVSRRRVAPRTC
jgi:hypothetical protein